MCFGGGGRGKIIFSFDGKDRYGHLAVQSINCIWEVSIFMLGEIKMIKLDGKVALIIESTAELGEGISTVYTRYGTKLIMAILSPAV